MNKNFKKIGILFVTSIVASTNVYGVRTVIFEHTEEMRKEIGGNPGHIIYKGKTIKENEQFGEEVKGNIVHQYRVHNILKNDKTTIGESLQVIWGNLNEPLLISTVKFSFGLTDNQNAKLGISRTKELFLSKN